MARQPSTTIDTNNKKEDHVANATCECWYICRYKVVSKTIKEYLTKNSSDVYFPLKKVCKKDEKTCKTEYMEQPCIPGYIFVKGPAYKAEAMAKGANMHLWKRHTARHGDRAAAGNASELDYFTVSQREMDRFMAAVNLSKNSIKLFDPADIDLAQDDEVEFISGPMQGQRGHIRIEKGKSGGVVIVPLSASMLHYGIKASPTDYRIVRFANSSRHNDCIKQANATAKKLLEDYRNGKTIGEKDRNRLQGYLLRFADTEMKTNIQRAQLTLLLYRINTILGNSYECRNIRHRINSIILPAYEARKETARGSKKESIERQKEKFLIDVQSIEDAATHITSASV